MKKITAVSAAFALAMPLAALAHHSFAMFDMSKSINYKGTVKEVQWTNPHVWVDIEVTADGKTSTLSFEGAAIPVLKRVGWTRGSVRQGDVVTVVGHPYKNGRLGGSIDYLILADGRKLGTGDAIPPALVVPGVSAQ